MKHSVLFYVQNSVILNFIIVWWKILTKMFTVVLSTKRNSASFIKETESLEESDERNEYQETKDSTEIMNAEQQGGVVVGQEFVPEQDCQFLLYTRLNPDEAQVLALDDVKGLGSSHFNPKLPVR